MGPSVYVFVVSSSMLIFSYAIYPLLLWIGHRVRSKKWIEDFITPSVTLYISAYNEEDSLKRKMRNAIAQDYLGVLNIVVADDGSTDSTSSISQEFSKSNKVVHWRSDENIGKTAMQNLLIPKIDTEIVVFSDATSIWEEDTVSRIVRHFADPEVGCVAVDIGFESGTGADVRRSHGFYWRYERAIRVWGASIWTNVVVSGTCYAIRKSLFETLPEEIAEDFGTPLQIARKGYRVVFDRNVVVGEMGAANIADESSMRGRIALQNVTAIFEYGLKTVRGGGFVAFQFFCHKVLRSIAWIWLVAIAGSSLFLLERPFFQFVVIAQLIAYVLATIGYYQLQKHGRSAWLGPITYFLLLVFSYSRGYRRYILGHRSARWQTRRG